MLRDYVLQPHADGAVLYVHFFQGLPFQWVLVCVFLSSLLFSLSCASVQSWTACLDSYQTICALKLDLYL